MTAEEAIQALKMMNLVDVHPFLHLEEMLVVRDMAIAALREQEERRWISVTERLPERTMPPCDVLVYHDLGCGMFVDRAWYSHDKKRWISVLGMKLKVTHWVPLPEPPKEDTNAKMQ